MGLARRLPRNLAYWVIIVAWSEASVANGSTPVDKITAREVAEVREPR